MPKIEYQEKNFRPATLETIGSANTIIAQYAAQGFSLTLRQLYYQFVSHGLLPNTDRSYKQLGNVVSDARRAGLIDWNSIEDRTRFIRQNSNWTTPSSILRSVVSSYHRDLWASQDLRIEVWIEKDALVGVIDAVCRELDVPFFSCRGYVSDSEMWTAAYNRMHDRVIVLHLGDHDPSGIDMTRDIRERLQMFSGGADIDVRRIALTMAQIEELGPPPNPAKITDSRFESYAAEYGDESWELDALEPQYIANLITEHVRAERDDVAWNEAVAEQETERQKIQDVIDLWNESDDGQDDEEDED